MKDAVVTVTIKRNNTRAFQCETAISFDGENVIVVFKSSTAFLILKID